MSTWVVQAYRSRSHGQTQFREVVIRHLGGYQPLGLPISLMLAALDADGEEQAAKQRSRFNYDASSQVKIENVVFVVGESSREDHWELNGYPRPTTPRLEEFKDLLSFSNVLSLAPNTVLSWPFIFTPRAVGDSGHWPDDKSFILAFKGAGYETYFVSFCFDQQSTRKDPLAIIAFEADHVINGLAGTENGSTDVAMLPAIKTILEPPGPKLVVISTEGSHPGFEAKRMQGFDFFKPSALDGTRTPEGWLNGYDDSIVMTDFFLSAIIKELEGSRSVLFYVSDHGLACYDKHENMIGQAFFKAEYRPACLVWASQEFLSDPEARNHFALGLRHTDAPITSGYVQDSLLDLCGIKTPMLDPSKSLFSSNLTPPGKWRVEDFQGHWLDFSQVPDSVK